MIDILIKKILIQDRRGESSLLEEPYRIQWTFANQEGLVVVGVYREVFQV
jgi:hypothetical protein